MGATQARPVGGKKKNNDGAQSINDASTSTCGCLGTATSRHHASHLRVLRSLDRRFHASDTNKSGGISYKELCRTLRIEHDLMSTRLFSLLDADGNKEITFHELSAALATFSRSELDRARFAFCLYDLDGNGRGAAPGSHTRVDNPSKNEFLVLVCFFHSPLSQTCLFRCVPRLCAAASSTARSWSASRRTR
jgi:hypothetical protein